MSLISGAPSFGGAGSGFGDESSDALNSRSRVGDISLSSPFTFGGDASATPGGSVPAWLIGAMVLGVAAVAIARRR